MLLHQLRLDDFPEFFHIDSFGLGLGSFGRIVTPALKYTDYCILNEIEAGKTIKNFWAHSTTLFDYIRRAMPMDKPQSLTPNEVYAVSAYILNLNGLVAADAVMDQNTLPKVQMPNRGGFVPDTRPDVGPKPRKK